MYIYNKKYVLIRNQIIYNYYYYIKYSIDYGHLQNFKTKLIFWRRTMIISVLNLYSIIE